MEFVHRDEDRRDYKVSFDKVNRQPGFGAQRSVLDGSDEIIGLARSGMLGAPDSDFYRN